jgi:hypothetical protein
MKRSAWYLLIFPFVLTVCSSSPAAAKSSAEPIISVSLEEEIVSSPLSVSQEMYDNTLAEVRLFVDRLNLMIKNKDYAGWRNALSDEFFTRISSPDFLANASKSALLRSKNIILVSPDDYFLYVVVPSRSNSRVDEIEFIAANSVKVFYIDKPEKNKTTEIRRLRLYELIKKSGDTWKIID